MSTSTGGSALRRSSWACDGSISRRMSQG